MKNYLAKQKSGYQLEFSCQAESLELAKKYFSEKSSIECDVWEDSDQTVWQSTNGYEGEYVEKDHIKKAIVVCFTNYYSRTQYQLVIGTKNARRAIKLVKDDNIGRKCDIIKTILIENKDFNALGLPFDISFESAIII